MVNFLMSYRALRRGLLIMCLMNPVFGASHSRLGTHSGVSSGESASMELLEYLGSLMETDDGLFGPDLFIEQGINDGAEEKLKDGATKKQTTDTSTSQSGIQSRKGASDEN